MRGIGKVGILLVLGIILLVGSLSCGGGGVSQEDYDAALFELADAQDEVAKLQTKLTEAEVLASQYLETNTRYGELQKKYDASLAEVADLQAVENQYDDLTAEYEKLQTQNIANQNNINQLENQKAQLQAQINELMAPLPEITAANIELALFDLINQTRTAVGLNTLQQGSNLKVWAITNCRAMVVSRVLEQYDAHWVPYQLAFIATGYDTVDAMLSAIMTIWESRQLQYQDNILADDAIYGAVAVERAGDIFYITFMASNYA